MHRFKSIQLHQFMLGFDSNRSSYEYLNFVTRAVTARVAPARKISLNEDQITYRKLGHVAHQLTLGDQRLAI